MSFLNKDNKVWLDGKIIGNEEAVISTVSHTLHYGSGVFEGVRSYPQDSSDVVNIFRLQDHTDRFFYSAKMINMELPFSKDELNNAQKEVVRINKISSAYIRPFAFYGDNFLGISAAGKNKVHVLIAAWPWSDYFARGQEDNQGISATVSNFKRNNIGSVLTKAKISGHYVNSLLATESALKDGYNEAILLDYNGFIAEASASNIFLVKKGVLYTPTDENILPGITRDTIMSLASSFNIQVVEKHLTRDELYIAEEIFLVGTAVEVSSVGQVDGKKVGNGLTGPITQKIKEAYYDVTHGKDKKYSQWNTCVN